MLKLFLAFSAVIFLQAKCQSFNPTILQDSRDLPKVDGTFGFLYRTEDGIAHAAKGDSNGVIHGRFSYTDPTGLKVNYNYNAGSRVAPGYNYNDPGPSGPRVRAEAPVYKQTAPVPPPQLEPLPLEPQYEEQEYVPRTRPPKQYTQYRDSGEVYQARRSRPPLRDNDINNDFRYSN